MGDDLNQRYRDAGWSEIAEAALGIEPANVESQARDVARWSYAEITRLRALNAELVEGLKWFCERVESGEVRSRRTYARFRALVAKAE